MKRGKMEGRDKDFPAGRREMGKEVV